MLTSTTANPSSVAIGADPALRAGRVGVAVARSTRPASDTARGRPGRRTSIASLVPSRVGQVAVAGARDALVVDPRARWRRPVRQHGHRARWPRPPPAGRTRYPGPGPDAAEDRAPERARRAAPPPSSRAGSPAPAARPARAPTTYTCCTLPPTLSLVCRAVPTPRPSRAATAAHRERRREPAPPELFAHSRHLWSSTLHGRACSRALASVPHRPRQETGSRGVGATRRKGLQ